MFEHIMLDLETLDTAPTAVVLSIGAVAFDPYSNEIGETFYVESDSAAHQQKNGRTISGATVRWWMQQSEEARKVFGALPELGTPTNTALRMFTDFVGRNGQDNVKVWGNGADFDNVILGSLFESYGMPRPWSYSKNRCYRTMKNIGIGPRRPKDREGVHHNALDDAITQAKHLQEIFKCLGQT